MAKVFDCDLQFHVWSIKHEDLVWEGERVPLLVDWTIQSHIFEYNDNKIRIYMDDRILYDDKLEAKIE